MITYTDECSDCKSSGYACSGDNCRNRNVKHLICDKCEYEVERLYKDGIEELCEDCLLEGFEVIE